jgi:hypothetical protein
MRFGFFFWPYTPQYTALIERGLRLVLARGRAGGRRARIKLPVSRATGGTHPGVNLDDSSAVMDRLGGRS